MSSISLIQSSASSNLLLILSNVVFISVNVFLIFDWFFAMVSVSLCTSH